MDEKDMEAREGGSEETNPYLRDRGKQFTSSKREHVSALTVLRRSLGISAFSTLPASGNVMQPCSHPGIGS